MMLVSVVIPTRNAGISFEKLLEKVKIQEIDGDMEIVIVDSGSTDQTLEVCEKFGIRPVEIKPGDFNHGGTRNIGIDMSKGKYVVLLVQDAIPVDDNWLNSMIEDLENDELIAGVYSKQIPRDDCNIFTRNALENWVTFSNERAEQFIRSSEQYRKMTPSEKQLAVTFDNVSSCIRKNIWQQIRFNEISFGEDIDWSKRVIEAGYKIVYEPKSAVVHSHNRTIGYEVRRTYVCHKTLKSMFGMQLVPTFGHVIGNFIIDVKRRTELVRKSSDGLESVGRWYAKAVFLSIGMQLAMYLGAKQLEGGKLAKLDKFLSRGV